MHTPKFDVCALLDGNKYNNKMLDQLIVVLIDSAGNDVIHKCPYTVSWEKIHSIKIFIHIFVNGLRSSKRKTCPSRQQKWSQFSQPATTKWYFTFMALTKRHNTPRSLWSEMFCLPIKTLLVNNISRDNATIYIVALPGRTNAKNLKIILFITYLLNEIWNHL